MARAEQPSGHFSFKLRIEVVQRKRKGDQSPHRAPAGRSPKSEDGDDLQTLYYVQVQCSIFLFVSVHPYGRDTDKVHFKLQNWVNSDRSQEGSKGTPWRSLLARLALSRIASEDRATHHVTVPKDTYHQIKLCES